MTSWVAVCNGALDLRERTDNSTEIEYMILAIYPAEPIGLQGEPAALWKRIVDGPVDSASLTSDELQLLQEFEDFGIASRDLSHPARITEVPKPWLSSLIHEMVYALIARVADAAHIRVVFIKGPVLHQQGLRTREHSGDVDVWVEPRSIELLVERMSDWGWTTWPDIWDGTTVNHSITLEASTWGCEIDLHRHMPGCALDDDPLFEQLFKRTDTLQFAGVSVRVPQRPTHTVIAGLHSLRPNRNRVPDQGAVATASSTFRDIGPELIEICDSMRATRAVWPALDQAFPGAVAQPSYPLPRNWTWRMHRSRIVGYFSALRLAPASARLGLVARLIWPSQEVVDATNARAGIRNRPGFSGRIARWKRALSI